MSAEDNDELKTAMMEAVNNAACILQQLTEMGEAVSQRQAETSVRLENASEQVKQQIHLAVGDIQSQITNQSKAALHTALEKEMSAFQQSMHQTVQQLKQATEQLHQERAQSARQARLLNWKTLGLVTITSLLLLGGSGFMVWQNVQQISQLREEKAALSVETEVLRALTKTNVTSCGGQPCVKLDQETRRWGKNKEFVLLK